MNKLYCFEYNITNKSVYRDEITLRSEDDFFYHFDDSETDEAIHVAKNLIDIPRTYESYETGKIIFVYTFVDDVNRAIHLIKEFVLKTLRLKEAEVAELKTLYNNIEVKAEEGKKKFPNGTSGDICNHIGNIRA